MKKKNKYVVFTFRGMRWRKRKKNTIAQGLWLEWPYERIVFFYYADMHKIFLWHFLFGIEIKFIGII